MTIINQFKIKTRIIVLVTIPLVAIFLLTAERYILAQQEVNNVQQLEVLEQYINAVSPLIRGVQTERFYSKLYLGPTNPSNPEGLQYKQQLLDSRPAVDKAIRKYKAFIANKEQLEQFPTLLKDIEKVLSALENFEFARSIIYQQKKTLPTQNGKQAGKENFGVTLR